ncbi:hypothetical protein CVT25_003522 [Psilocybe cyanescens]|uniref:Uncharacterized protein n=1 Tax=Psilocybe cyanescens TaxID=93625 RepID=A0A409XQZ1_PSICY|nr:hypothetical protein CVT25_003522 [Psilocybe cyanescens]
MFPADVLGLINSSFPHASSIYHLDPPQTFYASSSKEVELKKSPLRNGTTRSQLIFQSNSTNLNW